MKGVQEMFGTLAAIMVVSVLVGGALTAIHFYLEPRGVIDRFSSPVNWNKYLVEATGKKVFDECEKFLDEVSYVISLDRFESSCSLWYRVCTENVSNAPQSPWNKLTVSEADLNAMTYLKFDCAPSKIEEFRKEWEKKNSYFAEKNEYEQYNLIKNACGATLAEKINR